MSPDAQDICGDSARRGDAAARRRDGPGCKGRCRTRDPGDGLGGPDVNHVFGRGRKCQLRTEQDDLFGLASTSIRSYTRTIDFSQPASRATGATLPPAPRGGPPQPGTFDQSIGPANPAWAQQLQIWVTPWGFLRGAAARNATVRSRKIDGVNYNVVTWSPEQKAPRVSRIGSWVTSMTATRSNE